MIALIGQVVLGVNRSVAAHVVLGVSIVAAVAMLTPSVMTTPLPPGNSSDTPDHEPEPVA
ncbi:hypothetical protein [Streptomyces sp. JNUCC 63]